MTYYARRLTQWRAKGAPLKRLSSVAEASESRVSRCPRYLAHVLQRKARAARHAYERWSYDWEWQRWLPRFWKDIIQCETRSDFQWNSGSYQGAFGFAPSSWDGYKPRGYPAEAYQATPRQQYNVALAIVLGTGGTSGWGCA